MADFYCYVVNGVIERYNITKPKAHGNTAFGENVTDDELAALGYFPIVGEPPAYDGATERLEGPTYTVGEGVVTRSYTVVPYVPPVPQCVTMRQATQALILAGLDDEVEALLAAMPGVEGKMARAEWAKSQVVERNRPLVNQMGAALGLTSEQIDQLFVTAASLE
jgi:hypothetical protein